MLTNRVLENHLLAHEATFSVHFRRVMIFRGGISKLSISQFCDLILV